MSDAFATERVMELDLARPIAAIDPLDGVRALRILVRLRGAPVGWLRLAPNGDRIDAVHLRGAVAQHLPSHVQYAALRALLEAASNEGSLPAVSVVVCTRDRAESLAHCLMSLGTLDYDTLEIIVVDNAPTSDATKAVVATCTTPHPIRYVREERPGLDWARNRGLAEARYGIVAFTDDDVRVDRGWLRGLARGFADPATVLVTGFVAPAEIETEAQAVFEDRYGGMGKGFFAFAYHPAELTNTQLLGAHHLGVGANMAFRRDWLTALGGFDTALDVGTPSHGAGDLDAFERTLAAGGVARYEPTALVWHQHRREWSGLRRQLTDNGRAFGVYLITRSWRLARPVRDVAHYAIVVWLGWMAGRAARRLLGRERMPLTLQAAEWWGVLQAPWAAWASYRRDARVRQRHTPTTP